MSAKYIEIEFTVWIGSESGIMVVEFLRCDIYDRFTQWTDEHSALILAGLSQCAN